MDIGVESGWDSFLVGGAIKAFLFIIDALFYSNANMNMSTFLHSILRFGNMLR